MTVDPVDLAGPEEIARLLKLRPRWRRSMRSQAHLVRLTCVFCKNSISDQRRLKAGPYIVTCSERCAKARRDEAEAERMALLDARRKTVDIAYDALLAARYDDASRIIDEHGLLELREIHAVLSHSKRSERTYASMAAARRDGFVPLRPFFYGGEWTSFATRGKEHRFFLRDPVEAISETAWRSQGYEVISGAKPHGRRSNMVGGGRKTVMYDVYRADQVCPRATRATRASRVSNVATAT